MAQELKDYDIMDIEAMDDERLEKSSSGKIFVTRVYIKDEVDAVLAEKNKEIRKLKEKAQAEDDCAYWKTMAQKNAADNAEMAKQREKALKMECHHKYKRCLAMARWCASRSASWCFDPADDELHKSDFYEKWKLRWRELAEKFKPSNTTAQQGKG